MRRWESLSVDVPKKNIVPLNLSFRWQALFRVLARLSLRGRARAPRRGHPHWARVLPLWP